MEASLTARVIVIDLGEGSLQGQALLEEVEEEGNLLEETAARQRVWEDASA